MAYTTNTWINKAKEIHNDKYDYSLVNYSGNKNKVIIICKLHGEFLQIPNDHTQGRGCRYCGSESKGNYKKLTIEEFILRSNVKHNNKYDYSKSSYNDGYKTKICIICPDHGEFFSTGNNHLNGSGCPICNESKGENIIREWLISNNIEFRMSYRFKDCKSKQPLPFDFYLPNLNICIEYDGEQHFKATWPRNDKDIATKNLIMLQGRDKIKDLYCINNKIKLIRIPYNKFKNIGLILEDKIKG
jgi:rubrerythrin/very-short-patch-repair endonuclease